MQRYSLFSTAALISTLSLAGAAHADDVDLGLVTDINANGLAFGNTDAFGGGNFAFDDTAIDGLNDIIVYSGVGANNFDGAGYSIPISNGENGDGLPTNFEPVDTVFDRIGNTSDRLENGNVIRFSAWMRQDPALPWTGTEPQIEPVLKLEFWNIALSGNADFANAPNPAFGDRIFDTDQNGGIGTWVDINNDGDTTDGQPVSATLTPDAWTLVEHTYTVDDTNWQILDQGSFTAADVEEIRPVMFFGDFSGAADFAESGAIWVDNTLVEVFANAGAVTPNANPNPDGATGGIEGDYDDGGQVEQTDLDFVLSNWGDTDISDVTNWINFPGGGAFDGLVDQNELDGVLLNWGSTAAPSFAGSAVPEPASLGLLAAAGLVGLRRRR